MGKDNDMKSRHICDTVMTVNSDCKIDSDSSTACDSDNDTDTSSVYDKDNDCDTDNNCDAGSEKTQSFLYQHFIISIIPNLITGKVNMVFMKVTLLHTKGEDNNL